MIAPRRALAALVSVIVLVQASSCCCLLGGAVTPEMTPFAVEKESAEAMRERVNQAKAKRGPFTITVTDQELTSYLVGLAQSGAGEFPAKDMKLAFGAGYVEIWSTFVEIAPTELPVYVRATAQAANGKMVLLIAEANAGPFPVPGAMRELVAQSLSETLAELQSGLEIDAIEIRPGEMTLSGTISGQIPDLPSMVVN
jgi:hypothetical protein